VHLVLRGIQTAARDNDINLLVACGLTRGIGPSRHRPAWPEPSEESDFVPVGPWNTDGLIILAPPRSEERKRYACMLIDREFPVLFIGGGFGSPAIVVDNEMGIRQMMEHLVGHSHRRIAFIAGEEQDPSDGLARLTAYRKGVQELGLDSDPQLVEFGQNWDVGGYDAMQRMLKSGVKFTAVMCTNDASAVGVLHALRAAGLRVPWDVAVTGFDDHLAALAQVPPLTSVHYPMFETGYRSLLLLRKCMDSGLKALPQIVKVSTWIVPRQSCGCLPDTIASSVAVDRRSLPDARRDPDRFKKELSHAMVEALQIETTPVESREFQPLCDHLMESFLQSLEDGDLSHFQIALIEILQRVEMMREYDPHNWQKVISVLRQGARAILREDRTSLRAERAEVLLDQARTLLSDSAKRRYIRLQVEQMFYDESIGRLTAQLLSSQGEEQMYDTLAGNLPQVGINSCHVIYFEPLDGDPIAGSWMCAPEKDTPNLHFETRSFPPPGVYPEDKPFSLALLPLFFREENLGYVAFDGARLEPLATVVRQLASAIKSARLHDQVLELSLTDGLTGVHNRRYFDLMLEKETDRSLRYNRDLAVIMVDIDRFKLYNDEFGHPAGDKALQEVARSITQGARRDLDIVTRYGGEEFAIVLPETDAEGARIVAENMRTQMAASGKFLQPTTVSLGIASLRGNALRSQELVEKADRALYQAKHQGRDRAVVFEEWMLEAAHGTAKPEQGSAAVGMEE
jgi:diguanylate cyclase (GGDEF)-like protein